MEKEEKEALFDELYLLDKESEEEDLSNAPTILRHSSPTLRTGTRRSRFIDSSRPDCLARTVSAPLPQILSTPTTAHGSVNASFSSVMARKTLRDMVSETPSKGKQQSKAATAKDGPRVTGKRKRRHSMEFLPESQQIFKGLVFCTLC